MSYYFQIMNMVPIAYFNFRWDSIGYSLLGFVGGFLAGALFGKRASRDKLYFNYYHNRMGCYANSRYGKPQLSTARSNLPCFASSSRWRIWFQTNKTGCKK